MQKNSVREVVIVKMESKSIYLDNAATTKLDHSILKEVSEFQEKYFANPSSQHELGQEARRHIESARAKIAEFIDAEKEEIIFTSGGTEGDNFALRGLALANPNKKHIVTTVIEHPAIIDTCEAMKKNGYEVDYIGVDQHGIVDSADIMKKIRSDTLVVSVMHVNNEIGTIQPIKEIGEICKSKKVYFHVDAVQSFKKIDINVKESSIDLLTTSGHKIHAMRGIGFLYVKLGTRIQPIINGGGHEMKLRSGTENSPGIISLSKAITLNTEEDKVREVRDYLIDEILKIPGTRLNGSREKRVYNNLNVSFYGIEGESLMLLLSDAGIYCSTGSACSSSKLEESAVLLAMGVPDLYIHGSLRMTLGRDITKDDAKYVVKKIKESVEKLREMSPFKLNLEEENE